MSKVKIVTTGQETSRITSFGEVKFDSEGVSIDSYDRGDIERLIEVSASLSIEGEKKVVKREPVKLEKEEVKADVDTSGTFTQDQVNEQILENANRLVAAISEALGIDQSIIETALVMPTIPEPHLLVSVEEYQRLTSTTLEEGTEGIQHSGISESLPLVKSLESTDVLAARDNMKNLKMDELRDILVKSGVDESAWKDLKGPEGKTAMIEIIIDSIKKDEK